MTTWNTYHTSGYTHDVANDQASAGGVHLHQVRRVLSGWQRRILQSNGRHQACGDIASISKEDGEAKYATALKS
jgi:hypothetical protein